MTDDTTVTRHEQLVLTMRKREEEARSNPEKYRQEVVYAAIFGYLFPFFVLFSLTGLVIFIGWLVLTHNGTGAFVFLKSAIIVVPFITALFGSLWITYDKPVGVRLKPADQPVLFETIEDVRSALGGPKLDEIYASNELNASIQQTPRFGLLGGHVNRLVIGTPLLGLLNKEEFKSVLAHEFGHLVGSHGKTASWIYRTRLMWAKLHANLNRQASVLNLPLRRFFNWYDPLFQEISFSLARENEYFADAAAAELTGPETTARALTKVALASHYIESDFWPAMDKKANNLPEPDLLPARHFVERLPDIHQYEKAQDWLRLILARQTGYSDTHPALKDRLAALKVNPPELERLDVSFLDLMGESGQRLINQFDNEWIEKTKDIWRQRFEAAKQQKQALAELDSRSAASDFSHADASAWIEKSIQLEDAQSAETKLAQALSLFPDDPVFLLELGRIRIERKDETGLGILSKASSLREDLKLFALNLQYRHLAEMGKYDEASKIADQLHIEYERHAAANQHITKLHWDDKLQPHQLPPDTVKKIEAVLANEKDIKAAYLVRKDSIYFENWKSNHLVVRPGHEETFNYDALAERFMTAEFDGQSLYLHFSTSHTTWMQSICKDVPGSILIKP